jgi:ABC-type polysaccharide/polyol phosphate transport system ATPase subunit
MAVGDAAFQAKCTQRVSEMAAAGATLLVVSHQLELIETMCSRALWLDKGRLRLDAPVGEVVAAYQPHDGIAAAPSSGFATPHSGR